MNHFKRMSDLASKLLKTKSEEEFDVLVQNLQDSDKQDLKALAEEYGGSMWQKWEKGTYVFHFSSREDAEGFRNEAESGFGGEAEFSDVIDPEGSGSGSGSPKGGNEEYTPTTAGGKIAKNNDCFIVEVSGIREGEKEILASAEDDFNGAYANSRGMYAFDSWNDADGFWNWLMNEAEDVGFDEVVAYNPNGEELDDSGEPYD